MSFFYICSNCGRGFTGEDPFKSGVFNKMFKPDWQANGPQAGMYSASPTRRCPYCLSKDSTVGTEQQRGVYHREKRAYPAPDPRYPAVVTAQKYEDCEVNADIAEREIRGMSGEAGQRLQKFLDDCGWEVSDAVLKDMSAEFVRGIICYTPAENAWTVYQNRKIVCAIRRGASDSDYLFSKNGRSFVPGEKAGRRLLKKVNRAIYDYSLMLRMAGGEKTADKGE